MTGRYLVLWALPGPWPGSDEPDPEGLVDAVHSAMAVERRHRRLPLGREDYRRYSAATAAIERIARKRGEPLVTVDAARLELWLPASETNARIRASFYPPAEAVRWVTALAGQLTDAEARGTIGSVAGYLERTGYGLVLGQSPESLGAYIELPARPAAPRAPRRQPAPAAAAAIVAAQPAWPAFSRSRPRRDAADQLWSLLASSLRSGEPLGVGAGARHDVIAEVLRHAATVVPSPVRVRVLHVDGSEPAPFPLWPIDGTPDDRSVTADLRVGLMSMRHTDRDPDVDGYWFRNRLVSTSRTLAETDAYCAGATIERLGELHNAGVRRIELLHTTGFEPASLGFYRGLVEWLSTTKADLVVRPLYLIGELTPGTPWAWTRRSSW